MEDQTEQNGPTSTYKPLTNTPANGGKSPP